MTKDEALKLALEALRLCTNVGMIPMYLQANQTAITAIKEALAQPEHDYKDLYEKEKRKSAMWLAKYEEVAGPAPKAIPMAQPEQEPLEYWNAVEGWVKIEEVREHFDSVGCGTIYKTAGEDRTPLYTTPPQRTWVGLTKDEVETLSYQAEGNTWKAVELAEAALKAKNT